MRHNQLDLNDDDLLLILRSLEAKAAKRGMPQWLSKEYRALHDRIERVAAERFAQHV